MPKKVILLASGLMLSPGMGRTQTDWPLPCRKPLIYVTSRREIYKDGQKLGESLKDYKTSCSGDVAWRNAFDDLFRNDRKLNDPSSSAKSYEIALHTGDVAWGDTYSVLYKNPVKNSARHQLGNYKRYKINDFTGRVVWTDSYNEIYWDAAYPNLEKLGDNALQFETPFWTGDVVWVNDQRHLFKNDQKLGIPFGPIKISQYTGAIAWQDQANHVYKDGNPLGSSVVKFEVAFYTGGVVWLDRWRDLYKNTIKIGSDVVDFSLETDGRVSWVDARGQRHYHWAKSPAAIGTSPLVVIPAEAAAYAGMTNKGKF